MHPGATLRPAARSIAPDAIRTKPRRLASSSGAAPSTPGLRSPWLFPAFAGIAVVAWAVALLLADRAHIVIESRSLAAAVVAALTVSRLVAAALLLTFPDERVAPVLRWLGAGLLVHALGTIAICQLLPYLREGGSSEQAANGTAVIWLASGGIWLVGLVPPRAPDLKPRRAAAVVGLPVAIGLFVAWNASHLPRLTTVDRVGGSLPRQDGPLQNLTPWHWCVTGLAVALPLVALVLIFHRLPGGALRDFLAVGCVLFAGAALHYAMWPGGFKEAATSTNLLRLTSVLAVLAGTVVALRRTAVDRANLLAEAQARLEPLDTAVDRAADLGAIVAHELRSPIAAVRGLVDILSLPDLDPATRLHQLATIRAETLVLSVLAEDIKTLGAVEQDLLRVAPIPVDLGHLIGDAVGFARSLPSRHPLEWPQTITGRVVADPERIALIFRNLLTNAAKYSPPGTPIEIRVQRQGDHFRLDVVDHGPGIAPEHASCVFAKFDRGCHHASPIPGAGIGLYISRELVRAHGSDLTLEPTPGGGATFVFTLERAP
jgi:signal transduction histidine kinase